jgi:hypothetical protein
MAKLGSFFRRLFSPKSSDDQQPSSSTLTLETRKNMLIIPPLSPPKLVTTRLPLMTTKSCSASPRLGVKQTSMHNNQINEISNSNFLSSDVLKANIRRLSAPLITHTPANHHPQYSSAIVNESTEEALLSSLHRLSLSSSPKLPAHPNNSIHSLGTSAGGDGSGSPLLRSDVRSASFNLSSSPSTLSNNVINNIFSTSGRWRNVFLFLEKS